MHLAHNTHFSQPANSQRLPFKHITWQSVSNEKCSQQTSGIACEKLNY